MKACFWGWTQNTTWIHQIFLLTQIDLHCVLPSADLSHVIDSANFDHCVEYRLFSHVRTDTSNKNAFKNYVLISCFTLRYKSFTCYVVIHIMSYVMTFLVFNRYMSRYCVPRILPMLLIFKSCTMLRIYQFHV
jgi:hypothetical protein